MVSFAPEVIFNLGPLPITNTLINTVFVDGLIIVGIYFLNKNFKQIPGIFQNLFEMVIDGFYSLTESIAGKNTGKIFPYFMSFFLFIIIANWSGLIPGVGAIGLVENDHGKTVIVPFMKSATSDLNVTFALALTSLVATHMLSIQTLGIKEYLSRFFSLNPIILFVGLLEIISEITKLVSLSFRLFGNIFAGEVVIHTVSGIFAFIFPIPFLFLEVIVGLVQALVFAMLTMVFMSILMTPHHQEEHTTSEGVINK